MSKKGTTLGELMGKKAEHAQARGIEFHDLPELLGDYSPKVEFHHLGRLRLVRALKNRFGANYRSVPGISELLSKFDREMHIEAQHHLIKKRLGRKA